MGDNLGSHFSSDDLTGTYRCVVRASEFTGKNASKKVPQYRGVDTKASYLSLKFEVADEDDEQFGVQFPSGGGFEGEMYEFFPYIENKMDLKPAERRDVMKEYNRRLARYRSLGVPESKLDTVTAEELDGLVVDITVRTSVSNKDNVTKYHNINKVEQVEEVEDDLYNV